MDTTSHASVMKNSWHQNTCTFGAVHDGFNILGARLLHLCSAPYLLPKWIADVNIVTFPFLQALQR
jgi:hypothetical protein